MFLVHISATTHWACADTKSWQQHGVCWHNIYTQSMQARVQVEQYELGELALCSGEVYQNRHVATISKFSTFCGFYKEFPRLS